MYSFPKLPDEYEPQGHNDGLPCHEALQLKGHEGPVFVVRYNQQGTYCVSGGKVGLLITAAVVEERHVALRLGYRFTKVLHTLVRGRIHDDAAHTCATWPCTTTTRIATSASGIRFVECW
jgi:hypothetical protein